MNMDETTDAYLAIVDEPMAVIGWDDAARAEWWPLSDFPHLAFDHYDIMQDAIRKKLKVKRFVTFNG